MFLRGRKNVLKRGLIHVGALNLSLVMRQLLGKGSSSQQNETTSATGRQGPFSIWDFAYLKEEYFPLSNLSRCL